MRLAGFASLVLLSSVALIGTTAAPAAAASTTVTDGSARFQVLTPTLIRMEYAGDGAFQDAATFTAVNRGFPATTITTSVTADGYREISTGALTLRYKRGSGPFTAANVTVTGTGVNAAPVFPSYCAVQTLCEAENGLLYRHAGVAADHTGATGSGFADGYEDSGSGFGTDVSAVPAAGSYRLAVRYANAVGSDGQSASRTLTVHVNGATGPKLTLAPTASWDTWAVATATVNLRAGTNAIQVLRDDSDSGRVNVDSLAVATSGYPGVSTTLATTAYGAGPNTTLGGWTRSLDNPPVVPVPEHPGLLNRGGWYLLDDTRTALRTGDRPSHGAQPYQDGYFFGYGTDYKRALGDLNALTGPANLLPQSAYGLWYSRYYAYTAADYRNLIAKFRDAAIGLDWLVVDTDWKSPSQWNGWNWNTPLLGDEATFFTWAKSEGLAVTLNVHPSIATNDPRYATANARAGGLVPDGSNGAFDWSNPNHLAAYLDLHRPFEDQGVRAWWLDYCTSCGGSLATDPQVGPDNLINQAYADEFTGRGVRGFSFARIGGSERGGITSAYPIGPWSERRNTLQFTGDTPATWDMLAYEVRYTADEAAAGLSNVSHDIGSFHGGHLADDLYARWVQFGTFQPIDRLHSDHGDRLPWDYTGDAAASAQRFLRLRSALEPYTYTAAKQATTTGVPIVRPMYLDNPTAFDKTGEYMYGDNLLVAPITSTSGSTSVWVPPGSWTDWFTGTTYTGPATVTISSPLTRMPVLLKAGGIVPTRTDAARNDTAPLTQVTLNVAAGANGTGSLYTDAGDGAANGTTNAYTWTDSTRTLTIGDASRTYTLRLSNASAPTAVSADGVQLPETAWSYNADRRVVTVNAGRAHTITLTGSAAGNPAGGEVVGLAGLCLDVRSGVRVQTCDHTAAQAVTFDGAVHVQGGCLTATSPVTVTACGGANQAWSRTSDASLVAPDGRCLDVPGANATPGAVVLQLYACNQTDAQKWRLPPGPLTGPAGLCADVADADPASGTATQLYTCNNSDAQRWSTPGDKTVRTFGKCLDVHGGLTANGTAVQLYDCNGSSAQQWVNRADGSVLNPQSGRCLDDAGGLARAGDRLQIYDCNQTAAQKFTWH